MSTPILWLAFLQIVPMWPVKLNLESIVTAKSLRFSTFFISSLFAQRADAALLIAWLYPMFIVWYFLRVPARRLESYHLVAARAPSLSLNETFTVSLHLMTSDIFFFNFHNLARKIHSYWWGQEPSPFEDLKAQKAWRLKTIVCERVCKVTITSSFKSSVKNCRSSKRAFTQHEKANLS